MNLQHFLNRLTQVGEHLGPFRERLEEAAKSAPTDELKKMAADLLQGISETYAECGAEIKNMVGIYEDEHGKLTAAADRLKAAVAAEEELQKKPVPPPPVVPAFVYDPDLIERTKQQLLAHVGIASTPLAARETDVGQNFADWVNESQASAAPSAAENADIAESAKSAASTTAARFDSWLNESIRTVGGSSMAKPIPASTDSADDRREWEKMLGR